ncbi:tRNA (adenine(22)-N(1))-methyltransferase [Halobacillus karajensis]|uniref:tRNA (Adenine(22)-N(1))-methyltransferase n=1 Tax=Halobacillus karajensis TaxID=195088 RepID=A0A024P5N5_9BACI|nr:tRNA (adenine(22)-N(1))-methyltransferase TrmK [Halobacillus karajensis]CDQ18024.1 tRNA (adenine(22)-N(1))-methyltransferase [Halobacillus karajensis]CDQ24374.1 tRNA (adenine(22)-N(1))-methyltransferase [Halobacillus karajensis]CDQ29378.1 tRNA (adenine(22)-N(1))-methyltransferase [Halobacillus karajensis]
MNVNQLSQRLARVADYLPKGAHFADIGSDHAYLPCFVCLHDLEARAVAGEVNQGPFDSAKNEVEKHGLEERIDVRLGDGLTVVQKGEVEQVVIAGMGGPLIRDILDSGKEKLSNVNRIVVQPNIDSRSLRKWFYEQGFLLVDETIIEENGHIYEILVAEKGNPSTCYNNETFEKEMWLGPFLLESQTEPFIQKCREEWKKKQYIVSQMKQAYSPDEEKLKQQNKEIQWLEEVLRK